MLQISPMRNHFHELDSYRTKYTSTKHITIRDVKMYNFKKTLYIFSLDFNDALKSWQRVQVKTVIGQS
jgi:hypothetical protein